MDTTQHTNFQQPLPLPAMWVMLTLRSDPDANPEPCPAAQYVYESQPVAAADVAALCEAVSRGAATAAAPCEVLPVWISAAPNMRLLLTARRPVQ